MLVGRGTLYRTFIHPMEARSEYLFDSLTQDEPSCNGCVCVIELGCVLRQSRRRRIAHHVMVVPGQVARSGPQYESAWRQPTLKGIPQNCRLGKFNCHADRRGPAFSDVWFLLAGPRSGGASLFFFLALILTPIQRAARPMRFTPEIL